ncbi:hypothetical protein ACHMZP_32125 [Rhodococcus baikonurensis]|uniref:hypothetical protein n=1 Tax=Rhodococcus erythropolis group TaxID=2840174 RepID=UPI000BB3D260|nr:hypothetical protein [Rhodococcus erythropolis]
MVAAVAVVTLSSCASGEDGGAAAPSSIAGGAAASIAAPVPLDDAKSFDSIVGPYASFGTDAEAGHFPRTIRHALSETVIESK